MPAPLPIVVQPSKEWEGNDGPWSTFTLDVGTPAQAMRVLVDTADQETWLVLPNGCNATSDPKDCDKQRGCLYDYARSLSWVSTASLWKGSGIYKLNNVITETLGIAGMTGMYGLDTIGLSQNSFSVMNSLMVSAYASKKAFIGHFGISPRSVNLTTTDDDEAITERKTSSFLFRLKAEGKIPSLSWGYTAGSVFRSKTLRNAFGSLTLGGYDASRFLPNNVVFPFAPNSGRELVVGMQSITKKNDKGDGGLQLLPTSQFMSIDSTQSSMWLPMEACALFEDAFGLRWNETNTLYTIDEGRHQALLTENASISFSLTPALDPLLKNITASDNNTVVINIPYAAFALQAKWPIAAEPTLYFPLRRANDTWQYTLGRVFLQEAYVIADYERNRFSVSQVTWNESAEADIKGISVVDTKSPPNSTEPGIIHHDRSLGSGAIAGVTLGSIFGFILIAYVCWILFARRNRKSETKDTPASSESSSIPELSPDRCFYEVYGSDVKELNSAKDASELQGYSPAAELGGCTFAAELESPCQKS